MVLFFSIFLVGYWITYLCISLQEKELISIVSSVILVLLSGASACAFVIINNDFASSVVDLAATVEALNLAMSQTLSVERKYEFYTTMVPHVIGIHDYVAARFANIIS
jgi:nitrate reductase cytochrome c-type subunit